MERDIRSMLGGHGEDDSAAPKKTVYDMDKCRQGAEVVASDESVRMVAATTVGYAKLYYDAALKAGLPQEVAEQMTLTIFEMTIGD